MVGRKSDGAGRPLLDIGIGGSGESVPDIKNPRTKTIFETTNSNLDFIKCVEPRKEFCVAAAFQTGVEGS